MVTRDAHNVKQRIRTPPQQPIWCKICKAGGLYPQKRIPMGLHSSRQTISGVLVTTTPAWLIKTVCCSGNSRFFSATPISVLLQYILTGRVRSAEAERQRKIISSKGEERQVSESCRRFAVSYTSVIRNESYDEYGSSPEGAQVCR